MKQIKAACVQLNHVPGDKKTNLKKIEKFTEAAAGKGVELLVFPEMCITGYWHVRNLGRKEIEDLGEYIPEGPSIKKLQSLAEKYTVTIGAGLIEKTKGGGIYNTYIVAVPGGGIAKHRKLHCFISEHMKSGDEYTVFELPGGGKAGILVCYDNNIGENVRITALMGAEILLSPHQTGGCNSPSPKCMGTIDPQLWRNRELEPEPIEAEFRGPKGREWIMRWLPARAHDNGMFLLFSNGVGVDDDEVRTGNAMILDPYGDILAETWKAGEDMVIADLDPKLLDMCTGRRWIKTRRPELYGILSSATGKEEDTRKIRFEK